jgi:multidrug efflux pump subunit AcrA (membrane-fusion protein)
MAFWTRKLGPWVVGAALLAAGGSLYALARPRGVRLPVAPVTRGSLRASVLCAGSLQAPPGGELRASEAGRVSAIPQAEGQRVRAGDVLVALENPELEALALQAREELAHLESDRAAAAAELEAARREAAVRAQVTEADGRLLEKGAITREASEANRLLAAQAAARLKSAEARSASLEEGRPSRLALVRERAGVLERRVSALRIRAGLDGVAYGLPRRRGEDVTIGAVVASVVDPSRLPVRARVDQPDLPHVAAGQSLVVTFDGLPERRWEGRVASVPAAVSEVGGREVGEVQGEIADPERLLPLGASVNVEIVVGERPGALVIPRAALRREGDRRFVYRFSEGRARRADVTIGLVGLTEAEVTAGLSEGDRVLLPGAAPVSDGDRVVPAG